MLSSLMLWDAWETQVLAAPRGLAMALHLKHMFYLLV